MQIRTLEFWVGCFILAGIAALFTLAFKVADASFDSRGDNYVLYAKFDNVGSLKVRSPVKVGGVLVGRVTAIRLDERDMVPEVEMSLDSRVGQFSDSTSASILTAGLLGEQYIGLRPGFVMEDTEMLKDGDRIADTKSAVVLEDLIGQFLYSVKDGS